MLRTDDEVCAPTPAETNETVSEPCWFALAVNAVPARYLQRADFDPVQSRVRDQ